MADFLLFLGKLNLTVGTAIIVVFLLRRPLRALFGTPIAYAIWLLLSIAFNEFRPHYILGMLEFPSVLPLVLICIYYLAYANWERKQKP